MTSVPLNELSHVFTFFTTVFKTHFSMQYVWEGQHRQDTLYYCTFFQQQLHGRQPLGWPRKASWDAAPMIRGGWRRWTSHQQGDVEFRGDGVNFQGILKRLVLKKHPERMLQAFHMARNKSLKLGEGDYTTGISACGRSKLWQDACWILPRCWTRK